jgi:hypothetical protein
MSWRDFGLMFHDIIPLMQTADATGGVYRCRPNQGSDEDIGVKTPRRRLCQRIPECALLPIVLFHPRRGIAWSTAHKNKNAGSPRGAANRRLWMKLVSFGPRAVAHAPRGSSFVRNPLMGGVAAGPTGTGARGQ